MVGVVSQMAALVACGVLWRLLQPAGVSAEQLRSALTSLVYYLLLPALVLQVLWQAPLGVDALRISFLAATGVACGLLLMWLAARALRFTATQTGALLLAAAFPNVTYLGLPVLEATFGTWARSVAIQYDLFATTPLLLSVGIMLAAFYGRRGQMENPLLALLKVPPIWAAAVAVGLNLGGVPMSSWMSDWLGRMAIGVAPLMLIALGLGLKLDAVSLPNLLRVTPVILIQLLLVPLLLWPLASLLGLRGDWLVAFVLEAAMPAMVLGLVLCDRFGLDTGLYASAVTITTVLSLVTLPMWYDLLMAYP